MSNIFDPTRALPVDENEERDEMDDFMASLDAKAKKFKQAMIADAFREYSNYAKAERKKLVEFALSEVTKAIEEARPAMVAEIVASISAECEKVGVVVAKCSEAQAKLEEAIAKIKTAPSPELSFGVTDMIVDRIKEDIGAVRQEMAAMESRSISTGDQRQADHQALIDAVNAAIRSIPTPERPASFTIERDDYNKITRVVPVY
jgi:hypothetical protein